MSFASEVKKELISTGVENDCCASSMLAGMLCFGGKFSADDYYTLHSESYLLLDFLSNLCAEKYLICPTLLKQSGSYSLILPDATMLMTELDILRSGEVKFSIPDLMNDCCKRAFIRGAFLGGGTISDPKKQNHLEFSTPHFGLSDHFSKLLEEFDIPSKTLKRKYKFVTYFKDNDIICDILAIMGAGRSALTLSEISISKDIANKNNRLNNSETANYEKTVAASIKQIFAIEIIDRKMGLENLPPQLRELALLRLEYKSLSLAELADKLEISKSGVNHRMRKIIQIAGDLENE